jgi:hypothetical protein
MQPLELGRAAGWLVLIGCLAALGFFGYRIFALRLETGNTFPEYSTYRADPKGLKAFYEGLQGLHRIQVSRRLLESKVLLSSETRVLIFAGISPDKWDVSQEDSDLFDHWLESGGRLIFALRPEKALGSEQDKLANPRHEDRTFPIQWLDLVRRWGATVHSTDDTVPETVRSSLFTRNNRWFGRNTFNQLSPDWKSVAVIHGKNVIVERAVGPGSLVLMADSYPLSNESLATDRQTNLLLWLLNNRPGVVFDENHLGVTEPAGITTLAKRYGLGGAMASVVAVLLLFIWRCQYSLIPKSRANQKELTVTGSSSEQTFLNLLQISIRERDLIGVCIKTWLPNAKPTAAQLTFIRTLQSESDQTESVVAQYNRLTSVLNKKV